jgi:hypothetical protein
MTLTPHAARRTRIVSVITSHTFINDGNTL